MNIINHEFLNQKSDTNGKPDYQASETVIEENEQVMASKMRPEV